MPPNNLDQKIKKAKKELRAAQIKAKKAANQAKTAAKVANDKKSKAITAESQAAQAAIKALSAKKAAALAARMSAQTAIESARAAQAAAKAKAKLDKLLAESIGESAESIVDMTCGEAKKAVVIAESAVSSALLSYNAAKIDEKASDKARAAARVGSLSASKIYYAAKKLSDKLCKIPMNPACPPAKVATREAKRAKDRAFAAYVTAQAKHASAKEVVKISKASLLSAQKGLSIAKEVKKKVCGK